MINNGTMATNCGAAPVPHSITTQPVSLVVTQGESATFSVTAAGDPVLNYQWRVNDADLDGQTNSTLTISNSQPSNEGAYRVRVSNSAGTALSDPALLRVLFPPLISSVNVAGTAFNFSFSTRVGFTYTVEYKNILTDLNWTTLEVRTGTGGALPASDITTSTPTRFYRVRV